MKHHILALALLISVTSLGGARAEALDLFQHEPITLPLLILPESPAEKPAKAQITKHKAVSGDNLTKIALKYQTSWRKLYDANKHIENPDAIKVGQTIRIPAKDEKLQPRPLPIFPIATFSPVSSPAPTPVNSSLPPKNSSGNTYAPGNCTFFAKSQRPDLPNNLGDADSWYYRAASQGFAVGSKPRVGAVAAARGYMHVAIVIGVKGNKVRVAEMNYRGLGVVSERWSDNSEWQYIY